MTLFEPMYQGGHELVLLVADPKAGYRGIIAVHSTALGTAVGGTRWWTYDSDEAALVDALRLSRGMSFKNALAGLPLGGGKSVILGAPNQDRVAVLEAHGRAIDRLGGIYITGEDVGTTVADMDVIARTTKFVAGRGNGSGDPSPHTARGVFRAMQAAAKFRWGSDELRGRTVALQGCGNVGFNLAKELTRAGARVVASDIDPAKVDRVVNELGGTRHDPAAIHTVKADIFAPCAMGAVFDDRTIPVLAVTLVVGGANNQLLEPRHGEALEARGITYVPDYVANAGGVSHGGAIEVLKRSAAEAAKKVDGIYDTTMMVLERARQDRIPPSTAADRLAMEIIAAKNAKGRA
jgi:leucine dehydrogenase